MVHRLNQSIIYAKIHLDLRKSAFTNQVFPILQEIQRIEVISSYLLKKTVEFLRTRF